MKVLKSGFKRSYAREWTGLALFLAAAMGLDYYLYLMPRRAALLAAPVEKADWFIVLRLPELPADPIGARQGVERLDQWLTALQAAGFKPFLLSTAMAAVSAKTGLPDKSVVLLYEPGYRHTYEGVAPVLKRHRVPATWVTTRLENKINRQYLSNHAFRRAQKTTGFDMGLFEASTMTFVLKPSRNSMERRPVPISWSSDAGAFGVNTADDLAALNRLNVETAWTGRQLVERIGESDPVADRARGHAPVRASLRDHGSRSRSSLPRLRSAGRARRSRNDRDLERRQDEREREARDRRRGARGGARGLSPLPPGLAARRARGSDP